MTFCKNKIFLSIFILIKKGMKLNICFNESLYYQIFTRGFSIIREHHSNQKSNSPRGIQECRQV